MTNNINADARKIAQIMRERGYIISAADIAVYLNDRRKIETAHSRGIDPYANGANPFAASHKTYAYNNRSAAYCAMQVVICELDNR